MTGQPFLPALLGAGSRIAFEAAFGADLSDITGAGWTWTDITADVRHVARATIVQGRQDNVGQAGAAQCGFTVNNAAGNYTPLNPVGTHTIRQNTPIRRRMTLDNGVTWKTRFQGYLDSANPVTDISATVKGVEITALGALGRIAGRKKPLRSPLYRTTVGATPAYFWPMEDGTGATAALEFLGRTPLRVASGAPAFGADGGGGAAAAVSHNVGDSLSVTLPSTVAANWRVAFALKPGAWAAGNHPTPLTVTTSDGSFFALTFNGVAGIGQVAYMRPDGTGVTGGANWGAACFDGKFHELSLEVFQNGADIAYIAYTDGVGIIGNPAFTGTATTLAPISRLTTNVNYIDGQYPMSITGLAAWQNIGPYATANGFAVGAAAFGYAGETASARLSRLMAEEGVALDLFGSSDVAMGPQGIDTLINLMRNCEAADHGLLYDGFGPGVAYQCRTARYNAAAALTLDMGPGKREVAPPFEPKFDRQQVKNLYTVSRPGGSSATSERVDGPLGTDPVNGIGVEDGSAPSLNLYRDDPLQDHADYLVALGTVPGYRFPSLNLNMRAIPARAAALLAAGGPGYRATIVNPASKAVDLPPDPIDLIVEGWTETTTVSTWEFAGNCSSYEPFRVGVADTDRADSGSSTLGLGVTAAAASLSVATTDPGDLWTTTAADWPFLIVVGPEVMQVNSVTGGSSPQTFAVTRAINGVAIAHTAGEPVHVYHPILAAL